MGQPKKAHNNNNNNNKVDEHTGGQTTDVQMVGTVIIWQMRCAFPLPTWQVLVQQPLTSLQHLPNGKGKRRAGLGNVHSNDIVKVISGTPKV